jgi:hypothetical protein
MIDLLSLGLLGRHVRRRPQDPTCRGVVRSHHRLRALEPASHRKHLGETEVEHLQAPIAVDHDVAGFQIAMRDAVVVRKTDRVGERNGVIEETIQAHSLDRNDLGERASFDELHGEKGGAVGFFDGIHRDNVGMFERRDGARFAHEAPVALGIAGGVFGENLECDVTTQFGIMGAVHFAHTALAELFDDLVVCESAADHIRLRFQLAEQVARVFETLRTVLGEATDAFHEPPGREMCLFHHFVDGAAGPPAVVPVGAEPVLAGGAHVDPVEHETARAVGDRHRIDALVRGVHRLTICRVLEGKELRADGRDDLHVESGFVELGRIFTMLLVVDVPWTTTTPIFG